jgi:hypothetical protein
MSAALQRVLPYKTAAGDPSFSSFDDPVMIDSQNLVVEAANGRDLDHPHYYYRLKFHLEISQGAATVKLVKLQRRMEDDTGFILIDSFSIEEAEDSLRQTYDQLRAKLPPRERLLLKQSQTHWLRARKSMGDGESDALTKARVRELAIRLWDRK